MAAQMSAIEWRVDGEGFMGLIGGRFDLIEMDTAAVPSAVEPGPGLESVEAVSDVVIEGDCAEGVSNEEGDY